MEKNNIVEEMYPDIDPEKAREMFKQYVNGNKAGREQMADIMKNVDNKEFERVHRLAVEMYKVEFKKFKAITDGKMLCLSEFSDLVHKNRAFRITLDVPSAYNELFSQYNFWLCGEKQYSISNNLCRRFLASNIKSIPTELLRLPFQSFQLLVPHGIIPMTTFENKKIFIRELIVADYFEKESAERVLHVLHRAFDDIGYFKIAINSDELHKCVDCSVEKMIQFTLKKQEIAGGELEFNETQQVELKNIFEFVIKSILYITGADADIQWVDESAELKTQLDRAKSGKKRKKLERRLEKAKKMYLVGHTIVLTRDERIMYDGIAQGLWKVSYRFIVQGHWRHQAYGEGHQLRKMIFINPFWKGESFDVAINNPHLVK